MYYEKLQIWKDGCSLVKLVYQITRNFPKHELFGLSSQMQRCSVSIPSNIAEGSMRGSKKEFVRFLHMSVGSAAELLTQISIAKDIGYIENDE